VLDDFVNILGKAVDVGAEVFLQQSEELFIDFEECRVGFVSER
jgi:hypothetical protein